MPDKFQQHNDEMKALGATGEYAIGTHSRFVVAKIHVKEFIDFK